MDLSQYIGFFVDEAQQHLEQCSALLLQLEQSPQNNEVLFEVFRLIHTLKGMAATLIEFPFFKELTALSHEMEDLLDDLRNQRFAVSPEVVDLLFVLTDALAVLVGKIADPDKEGPLEFEHLHKRISELRSQGRVSPAEHEFNLRHLTEMFSPQECQDIVDALKEGAQCAEIEVTLDHTCLMPNVRALLVLRNLEEVAEILLTSPHYELLEQGKFEQTFHVIVNYMGDLSVLKEAVLATTEIEQVKVESVVLKQAARLTPLQLSHPDIPGLNEFEERLIKEAHRQGLNSVLLALRLNALNKLSVAQITLIFRALEEKGEIIKSLPPVHELEEGNYHDFLAFVIITSESAKELERIIVGVESLGGQIQVSATLVEPTSRPVVVETTKLEPPPPSATKASHILRIDAKKLEYLTQLISEVVLSRTCLFKLLSGSKEPALRDTLNHFSSIVTSLQVLGLQLKLVPLAQVFKRFHRVTRDLAKQLEKDIELVIEGGDVGLERSLVEELMPQMIHLLRNSADHGIEKASERAASGKPDLGTITITAKYSQNEVVIGVHDDGRGIDTEKLKAKALEQGHYHKDELDAMSESESLNLIFLSGLTTQETATDISGRGVGMDSVCRNIHQLGGEVRIASELGKGTVMNLAFPQHHKIEEVLLFSVHRDTYCVPLSGIDQVTALEFSQFNDKGEVDLDGKVCPVLDLRDILISLNLNNQMEEQWEQRPMLVLKESGQGLLIDEIIGQETLLINRINATYDEAKYISGASVIESGGVALYLNLKSLSEL